MRSHGLPATAAVKAEWYTECYAQLLIVNVLILLLASTITETGALSLTCMVSALFVSVNCFVLMAKNSAPLANPVTIYIVIWLLLVPLTSFGVPLMKPMSSFEWQMCAGFGITYSIAGLLIAWRSPISVEEHISEHNLSRSQERALLGLIAISVIAIAVNFLMGGIALFSEDDMARKTAGAFYGYALLSSVGSIGIVLLANHYRLHRPVTYLILTASFIVLQALTGSRFVAIITLVMTGALIASRKLSKKHVRILLIGGICVLAVFIFVAYFRSSADHMEYYYISSGIYSGETSDLTSTELIRYFGMSQRNMSTVLSEDFEIGSLLEYTFSPITFLFQETPGGLGTSTYGYTANNIISYAYHDAGWMLWLVLFAWSLAVNISFVRYSRNKQSLTRSYLWAMMAMSLVMSFFAYFNAYVYWVLLFPIMVRVIEGLRSDEHARYCVQEHGALRQKTEVHCN